MSFTDDRLANVAINLVIGLMAAPTILAGPCATPRAKLCAQSSRFRATSTRIESESAFTTEAPTPCKPPEV